MEAIKLPKSIKENVGRRTKIFANLLNYAFDERLRKSDKLLIKKRIARDFEDGILNEAFIAISLSEMKELLKATNSNPFQNCITKVGDVIYVMNRCYKDNDFEKISVVKCKVVVIRLISSVYTTEPSFEIGVVCEPGYRLNGYNDLKTGEIKPSTEAILPGTDYQSNWFIDEDEAINHCNKMNKVIDDTSSSDEAGEDDEDCVG